MAASGLARASGTACPLMRLVTMSGVPILRQLQLEEWLLRRSEDNWCLINDGTAPPTIVMGMSGRVSELVEIQPVLRDQVPIVRRFSGGGTVIVDQGTVFVTFICNNSAVPGLLPFPRDIMSWSGQLYGKVFDRFGEFHLRENDYAFSHRKFGGNAQSITKKPRWVHHTSFLWDYDVKNMDYLKIPKRAPEYRLSRNHTDFLCRMKELMPSRSVFTDGVITALGDHFSVEPTDLETVLSNDEEFKPTTMLLSQQDLSGTGKPSEASRAATLAMATGASASSSGAGPSSPSPSPQAEDAHAPRQRLPPRPGSDPLLIVCGCFSLVTAATALLCVAVNVLSAVQAFRAGSDIFGGIFRCYAVVFALFVGVLETEWGFIIKFWKIFEYWPARGMLQIFVAVMTKAYPTIERNDLILLQEIASYMLLACGAVYVISGILCIGVLKRSRQQKATSRDQAVKDLQELEKRREELEALLLAERSELV